MKYFVKSCQIFGKSDGRFGSTAWVAHYLLIHCCAIFLFIWIGKYIITEIYLLQQWQRSSSWAINHWVVGSITKYFHSCHPCVIYVIYVIYDIHVSSSSHLACAMHICRILTPDSIGLKSAIMLKRFAPYLLFQTKRGAENGLDPENQSAKQ